MTDLAIAAHILPSPDLIKLEQDAAEIASRARSATLSAPTGMIGHTFPHGAAIWASRRSLPCPGSFALYMTAHRDRYAMATLNRRLSCDFGGPSDGRSPFRHPLPRDRTRDGWLRRTKTVRQRQVAALTTPLLKRTLGLILKPWRTNEIEL